MIATEYLITSLRIATVAVPVGVYFLILGLLNSRKHPQLLTGRQDFALLIAAISPLFVLPVLQHVGISPWTVAAAAAGVAGLILLLAPRGRAWVIYNLSQADARKAVARALSRIGMAFEESNKGFSLSEAKGFVEVGGFPLLHNVSVRLRGADKRTSARFEQALAPVVACVETETNPAGISLLLVATAALAAPFVMIAQEVPEIVRLLTDLL
ncbi:MAG TPA: hypothetical protein VM098_03775 [Phycisphaerae bacterium]|nr:hypothetical protein [Phycisphaerae bacterium]